MSKPESRSPTTPAPGLTPAPPASPPLDPAPAAQLLRTLAGPLRPRLAIVLGSGFAAVLDQLQVTRRVPYPDLPGFPATSVPGHPGQLLIGHLEQLPVVILAGRAHYYEGWSLAQISFPIRVLAQAGIQDLILTNAAGGIHPSLTPGGFMLLRDHINAMGDNPLRGHAAPNHDRFVDLSQAYDPQLRDLLRRAARRAKVPLPEGVYLAVPGPSYETPAEIRAFAKLGAHAVGMSTVPEAIVARQCGLRVAAVSCITNLAAGRSRGTLSHEEVLERGRSAGPNAARLLAHFTRLYGQAHPTTSRRRRA